MIRVCIVCEGMTEAEFVRTCMSRYFMGNGLNIFPYCFRHRLADIGAAASLCNVWLNSCRINIIRPIA